MTTPTQAPTFKWVPLEPTQAMIDAADKAVPTVFSIGDEYRAMVAAAPDWVMLTIDEIIDKGPGQEDAQWPYECQIYFARACIAAFIAKQGAKP